jgi:DNA-binding NtrC family response regulator/tetratricopeptide (TPR) repeat protein
MRGGPRRLRETLHVSLTAFAWGRPLLATLRHSSLPWHEQFATELELRARPLTERTDLGGRDRLSLLAQFAAHQSFLQFAGVPDGEVDPAEWAVIQKRGSDCRLVRVAAAPADARTAPPLLTLVHQFWELLGAPSLDVLRLSWARGEAVYAECFARLRADAVADLRWVRQAAWGKVLAPGPDSLPALVAANNRETYADSAAMDAAVEALRAYALLDGRFTLLLLRGGSILRYGALDELRPLGLRQMDSMAEGEIAERLAALVANRPLVMALADVAAFDEASKRVVQLAGSIDGLSWITPAAEGSLPESRWFLLSPTLASRRLIDERLAGVADRGQWLERFAAGPALAGYLDGGEVAEDGQQQLQLSEPARSYVAALALLGTHISREMAADFLRDFLFERPLEELAVDGISTVSEEMFAFTSEAVRLRCIGLIPAGSRAALSKAAARAAERSGDLVQAARLLVDAGETAAAAALLERAVRSSPLLGSSPEEMVRVLRAMPRSVLASSPLVAGAFAEALLEAGRYLEARDLAALLDEEQRELVLAGAERRIGDYAPALVRLERLPRNLEASLLRAEILTVLRRDDEACDLLSALDAGEDDDAQVRLGYARALLRMVGSDGWMQIASRTGDYYRARLGFYRSLERADHDAALGEVEASLAHASTTVQRIDALLDRMYALFAAGRWPEARQAAMEGLAEAEETQGDRAAGGFLFVLAYLCADDAQWAHAAQRILRLRHFYGGTSDGRHLDELDLLAAQLDFARGRFAAARRTAAALLARVNDPPIEAAGALILDEIDWIEGVDAPPRLQREPANPELRDRHRANLLRRGIAGELPDGPFARSLAAWEQTGGTAPVPSTPSETLKLFRAVLGLGRRLRNDAMLELARSISEELGLELDAPQALAAAPAELQVLRAAATCPFPPAAGELDVAWRFAARNRLGQWNEVGSLPLLPADELDGISAQVEGDWIACSERELLYLRSSSQWPAETREAVAAIFRDRSELHRLRRLLEQDEQVGAAPSANAAGIIGESPAIRETTALVSRIARRDVAVCILGESGTGKELVARAIHAGSARRQKSFTPVNCAALPENLIESELFGHVRGAFTGADRDRAGLIESTDGGTLFLDEIGEMPLAAQAKLLRFLQEGEFRRVGDSNNRTADVRIVSATNRRLDEAVEEGAFREDLYYRVRGVEIPLPPLRERAGDVTLLAAHFLAGERNRHRAGPTSFSPEVESIFLAYSWPGNVRELQNTIRAAHALAGEGRQIELEHLPERLRQVLRPRNMVGSYQDTVIRFRRDLIERSLLQAAGNQNRAASMLGISRQALAYQIRELGILVSKPSPKTAEL